MNNSRVFIVKLPRNLHQAQYDCEDKDSCSNDPGSNIFFPRLLLTPTSSHFLRAVDAVPGPDDLVVGRGSSHALQIRG